MLSDAKKKSVTVRCKKKKMKDYVIIVAGGKGLRMGSDIPKQFLPIGGKPVLMRTIERFREYSADLQIILVLPKGQQAYWKQLCHEYDFRVDYLLADGGETRFHSVQNGLALIPDDATGVVSVHDGVRPFPAIDVIGRCYETARAAGAAIPVIPVVETLRHLSGIGQERTNFDGIGLNGQARTTGAGQDGQERTNFDGIGQNGQTRTVCAGQDGQTQTEENSPYQSVQSDAKKESVTVPRGDYRLVQTPQAFDIQLLKAANRQPYSDAFTDDASVVEAFGHPITLVDGNRENIKLTTPYDLKIAEVLI